jgi:hypothetical protein
MRDIARDHRVEPEFDAMVVDEAQDQDTCWRASESGETECGWWEVFWKLLRENTSAPMAVFFVVATPRVLTFPVRSLGQR